ncbi:uncharacterized protein LOC143282234 [Babylonia areolata]|uniref:uncharacterized protein LOC143282234 n=1 Tax=Babylonia areolata TaxID=304850 RepID=UPI003FD5CA4D
MGFKVKTDKRIDNCAPGNRKMKTPALKYGTWNVRAMTPGFSDDLQEVNDAGKTAVIDRELSRLQMDIVALQETRLPETGSVRERDFTLFWQGKPSDEVREHGKGFAQKQKTFYDDLSAAIRRIPDRELLFIAGDFNARVGVDHNSWPTCLGQFGTGKMNENGQRLLELCCHHGLCISNTFFNTKPQHRVSWRHLRSKHWHQLDLILTRCVNLSSIKITRSYQSADCDTDHSLVCSNVKLRAKRLHRMKKEGRPRIDTSKTCDQRKVEEFARVLEVSLPGPPTANAQDRREHFRDAVYNAAMSTFGKKTSKSADWFEAHLEEMTPVIEAKRNALSEQSLQVLHAARSKVQQCARQCASDYWLQLCSQIQIAADTDNIKAMYDGIKQALGPTQKKTAPLKSATGEVNSRQQMERWVEHYTELYARENVVTEDALNAIECLPELEELDREPTIDELSVALDSFAFGKAPGKDGIPAERTSLDRARGAGSTMPSPFATEPILSDIMATLKATSDQMGSRMEAKMEELKQALKQEVRDLKDDYAALRSDLRGMREEMTKL